MVVDFIGYNYFSYIILKVIPLVLMGILIFNLIQKRFIPNWGKKRLATFYIAIMLAALLALAFLIYKYRLPDWILIPGILALISFAIARRKSIFPIVVKCEKCGSRLSLFAIFLQPENICRHCKETINNQAPENREPGA